jgi:hypothetical protein
MSWSQRTHGTRRARAAAIAGASAGKLGETATIRSGRPRNGIASVCTAAKESSWRMRCALVERPTISGSRTTGMPSRTSR